MSISVRQASIDELVSVNAQIIEFITPYKKEVFESRLDGVTWLGLVAEESGDLLGFKLGYEESETCFYSWLGGVLPQARGRGIAKLLLHKQEEWVRSQGYSSIHVKSRNRYRNMLKLLISEQYNIVDLEPYEPAPDSRVHFLKHLT